MPIWLRKLTYNQIRNHVQKANNQNNQDTVQQSISNMKSVGAVKDKSSPTKISPPSYVTKTSKK